MQHYNEDLYVKPKAFDRWRQYVNMRKLFRYWLEYINNRSEYIKSDMAVAFDRWKHYHVKSRTTLERRDKNYLEQRVVKNGKKLGVFAEDMEVREREI